jgi:cysteine desulfurase
MLVYLDNAATTKLDKRVLAKMLPYLTEKYGNASSLHVLGQEADLALQAAKTRVAKVLQGKPENLIFTSGASESNNLIIKGFCRANKNKGKHILVSAIEHPCVIKAAFQLANEGFIIETIPVNRDGLIELKVLEKMIRPDTILVSVMAINNEVGTIQDIVKIGNLVHKKGAYFHVDAVQAVPYLKIDLRKWPVDFLSLSAHKFYGPKGVGLVYADKKIKLEPIISGGGQEDHLRAGTYNLPGIVGLSYALELAYQERTKTIKQVKTWRDYFWKRIKAEIPNVKLNGSLVKRTPNNLNLMFLGIEGEAILFDLSAKGICVSTGSACSASNLKASYVLKAMDLDENNLNSNIRFSLGKNNTKKEIDYTIKVLKETVKRLRSFSPIKFIKK